MNSIFLRIYIGMLAALVLVGLLAVGSLQLVNILRHDHYREQLAQGTFRLMADNLAGMDAVERTRAIALWGRLLGTPLALEPLLELPLDSRARGRLMRGQVLVESQKPSLIYSLVSEKERLVLTATVEQVSEQLARATLFLISDELRRYPAPEQRQRLAELLVDKGFSYPVHLRAMDQMELDADQRRRLVEGDTVMALMHGGDAIRVMAAQVETPWILELGPLYPLNSYPPQLLALFTVLGLTLLGLTLYALVRRLEYRLRGLEAAVTRIAAGRLEARVPEGEADSVGRLAAAFNVMAEQVQRLISVQREMVRAVSHELRTPVARLRFGLEMVEDSEDPVQRARYLQGMDHDIQELDRLVDEMLVYARLEQGSPPLDFREVELPAMLERVMEEAAPLRVEVRLERGSWQAAADGGLIEAEPRYLQRAVLNLVSNALRHARQQVRVSYSIVEGLCRIDVEDDGPGVPRDAWERIFTPFLRLDDSRARALGGHGLGLSIVRRIIYWHGGRASVGSSPLGGARFSLIWPRRRPAE